MESDRQADDLVTKVYESPYIGWGQPIGKRYTRRGKSVSN